jgi:hypothetical protein
MSTLTPHTPDTCVGAELLFRFEGKSDEQPFCRESAEELMRMMSDESRGTISWLLRTQKQGVIDGVHFRCCSPGEHPCSVHQPAQAFDAATRRFREEEPDAPIIAA